MQTHNMSMFEKVEASGYDPDIFLEDILKVDDILGFDYSNEHLKKAVYPYLRILKDKYGMDIPLSLTGVDMYKLDIRLDNKLQTMTERLSCNKV